MLALKMIFLKPRWYDSKVSPKTNIGRELIYWNLQEYHIVLQEFQKEVWLLSNSVIKEAKKQIDGISLEEKLKIQRWI
jgi:hypothetical protein